MWKREPKDFLFRLFFRTFAPMKAALFDLDGVVFDTLWKASLNVATGTSFTLSPNNDSVYLVYRPW